MKMKKTTRKYLTNTFIYIMMSGLAFTMLFPYFWMISTSFKDKAMAIRVPIQWIPKPFLFDTYLEIWDMVPLLRGAVNSLKIIIPGITWGQFVSALAAFSFSKMDLPKKKTLFLLLMSAMLLPDDATMIPRYIIWGKLGLIDTFYPLILPSLFGGIGSMFFYRQFLNGIPREYVEAARIDGAGWIKTFITIFIPLMKPAIATQVIFGFVGGWNNFMGPLIYLDSEKNMTVQICLRLLSSTQEAVNEYPLVMTGAVVGSLPILILYLSFQKYFTDAMVISGVKG